jgi:DNA-binding transcriptional LysR family regulator
MELRQLNTFKVVAEVRGFTRAAEMLGYAQSSVTAQIQGLEEELGTPLFDRLGKKIVLTEAGQRLLPYAQELLKLHDTAKDSLQAEEVPTGTLTIGAPESLAAYRLPAVIQEYRQLYPQVKIILKPGLCYELRNLIRNGDIDVSFLLDAETPAHDLRTETLIVERMSLIAPPDHRLVTKADMVPADLNDETFLHTEPGCSYRGLFERQLQRQRVLPTTNLEFWNLEAIKNCVMCGLGLSYLPRVTVEAELQSGRIAALDWDDSETRVATQMIYHKGKWISPALREFLRVVRKHAAGWQ